MTRGGVDFTRPGSDGIADYVPRRVDLVRDRRRRIAALPEDAVGLAIGLAVSVDLLGRPIPGEPDIGAIEVP